MIEPNTESLTTQILAEHNNDPVEAMITMFDYLLSDKFSDTTLNLVVEFLVCFGVLRRLADMTEKKSGTNDS